MSNISNIKPLPLWNLRWWIWLPPLPLAAELALRASGSRAEAAAFFSGELGFTELATVALLLPAVVLATRACVRSSDPILRGWFGLLALGCLYFAGEEASWGQHIVQWQTPDAIAALNDQTETNLHNMSSWADQKPRLLLELWIVVGGLLVATSRWIRGIAFDASLSGHWFWPWREVIPSALLAFAVRWPERIASWRDEAPPLLFNYRLSESQELYFACFLLLFVWASWRRLIGEKQAVRLARRRSS